MALVKVNNLAAPLSGLDKLPMLRQLGLMVGFAAAIGLAVAIVLWAQAPNYRMLYGNLSSQEVLDISNALDQAGIQYQLNDVTGAIMVPSDNVHQARLQLAGLGLPKGSGTGYELLDKDQGFSTSQFIESARYQRALEGELARTISSLNSIQSARVHLGLPKQTGFLRDRKQPSASVMVTLYQGRQLSREQAASIVHMVASSIPNLHTDDVTVIDHTGRMLSEPDSADEMRQTSTRFDYRRKLEDYYVKRIENILAPIVGLEKVRAQVSAELDFTVTEQTQESFNPDLPAVRSEQSVEEHSTGSVIAGVPGTLSNQPPGAGATAEAEGENTPSGNSSRRMVRNYELDRTISRTRLPTGTVRRLSAAVVVDERQVVDEEGGVTREALSQEEIDRLTSLVKEAIGFSAQRGDTVNVINAPFQQPEAEASVPEPSLLEQPWLWDVARQALGALLVLVLIFGVLRPVLRSLASAADRTREPGERQGGGELQDDVLSLGNDGAPPQLAAPQAKLDEQINTAKAAVAQDPRRVAAMMKQWVESDG